MCQYANWLRYVYAAPSHRRSLAHYHIGTLLSVKQLEGEFAAYFLILPVGKAGKQTKVKDMRTNAIPHFQIRFQVRYYQCIQIQTFVQYILGIFHQMAEQKERCFVCKVSTDIFAGRVIPTSVKQLEHPANIIAPTHRQIGTSQVGKVHKVQFLLIGELSPTKAPINITHQSQRNLMLQINLHTCLLYTSDAADEL